MSFECYLNYDETASFHFPVSTLPARNDMSPCSVFMDTPGTFLFCLFVINETREAIRIDAVYLTYFVGRPHFSFPALLKLFLYFPALNSSVASLHGNADDRK